MCLGKLYLDYVMDFSGNLSNLTPALEEGLFSRLPVSNVLDLVFLTEYSS